MRHRCVTFAGQGPLMDKHLREHILISDPLAVRSFLLASSLRRLGLRASVMEAQDGAHDATFFLATYDLGGPRRLQTLRSRFSYMPIATYSEDPADAAGAKAQGADEHSSPNAYELAWLIRSYRRGSGPSDDARFGERMIPRVFTQEAPMLCGKVLPFRLSR